MYVVSSYQRRSSIPRSNEMRELQDEAKLMFLKIRNLKSELLDVVYACRTVAKLQEVRGCNKFCVTAYHKLLY